MFEYSPPYLRQLRCFGLSSDHLVSSWIVLLLKKFQYHIMLKNVAECAYRLETRRISDWWKTRVDQSIFNPDMPCYWEFQELLLLLLEKTELHNLTERPKFPRVKSLVWQHFKFCDETFVTRLRKKHCKWDGALHQTDMVCNHFFPVMSWCVLVVTNAWSWQNWIPVF